ncbi:hypothetical protein AYI70_g171 [Smittium culicis]|uniref:Uncharacterized protein n=1 Tax=Smittium culicis TaxID=133412 RepID=A0A1R1YHS1_9FUNG|nr:hypothetical protein AYI70_g171 [Smittium culicis]
MQLTTCMNNYPNRRKILRQCCPLYEAVISPASGKNKLGPTIPLNPFLSTPNSPINDFPLICSNRKLSSFLFFTSFSLTIAILLDFGNASENVRQIAEIDDSATDLSTTDSSFESRKFVSTGNIIFGAFNPIHTIDVCLVWSQLSCKFSKSSPSSLLEYSGPVYDILSNVLTNTGPKFFISFMSLVTITLGSSFITDDFNSQLFVSLFALSTFTASRKNTGTRCFTNSGRFSDVWFGK